MSKRRAPDIPPARPETLGTLGDLLAQQGVRGPAERPAREPSPAASPRRDPGTPDLGRCATLVVRRERKGHGGKTATVIDKLALPARDLAHLARGLRHALGCGASVEGDRVVVQGDQVDRVQAWLAAHGARRIVRGN